MKDFTMPRPVLPSVRKAVCQSLTAAVLALGASPWLGAADTNFVDAFRAARKTTPAVWGRIDLGTPTPATSDPRATAIAAGLRQGLNPPTAGPGTGAAHSATRTLRSGRSAIPTLAAPAGQGLEVRLRPGSQTVMQIRNPVPAPAPASARSAAASGAAVAEDTARRFLRANRALLRLDDPDQELSLERQQLDDLGRRHVRFSQKYRGLSVWPAGLSVHLDAHGTVDLVDGAYVPTPGTLNPQPVLSPDEATEGAKASVPGGRRTATDASLIIYAPLHRTPRLAWETVVTADLLYAWRVLVDARDGLVLGRVSLCLDANVPTSAADLENVTRNINVWSAAGKFYMIDTTKPSFNPAFDPLQDPHGAITLFDARLVTEQQLQTVYVVESAAVQSWLPDAVSALFNFGHTYDYFWTRHNRNSLDGQAGNISAAVRVAQMDNAFWNGDQKMMFFGNVHPYPAALDVVGHELTHGVTQYSADLIYELQPGALNESFSDIFGEMVEARVTGQPDWKMGTKLGKIFRDLKDPGSIQIGGLNRPYPSKMSEYLDLPNSNDADHGGVHLNSSIVNHAFYLLAEGLPGALGLLDAEKIFYRCLTQHLQKQSQFVDARLGCIAAAEALFGADSPQAAKTAEAFDAVEIFATPPTPDPTPLPTVPGPDATLLIGFDPAFLAIALGRRETALGDPADGVALVEFVKVARPSVSGDGSLAVFVDAINDLGVVATADPSTLQSLGVPGQVHSVALSPDASQYAFVLRDPITGQPDNRITVIDVVRTNTRSFDLLAPVQDGNAQNSVLYADSMVFTADGTQLIYDALSQLNLGSGVPLARWSISRLNLATETTTVLVPPLEGFDTGNPNLGRAGNRYLTFDANDLATGNTAIVNLDLFTGDAGLVGFVGAGTGYPCFTGDESAVVYAARDPSALWTGYSLVKQPLQPTRLATNGPPTLWLSDAAVGVIYRRGAFVNSNALPTVSLTAPANNATFTPPATVTLTATASDDGGLAKVEFYEGARKLGEDTAAPFQFVWTNVSAGNYRLTARALDTLGGATDSTAISITVGQDGPIRLSAARQPNRALRLTVSAPPGNYTIQESTNLTSWADLFPLGLDATGTGSVDDTRAAPPAGRLFYRARKN